MKIIKLALLCVCLLAAASAYAQVQVFVPGNATGGFGTPNAGWQFLVPAISVSGPATITVTYLSGTVIDAPGIIAGPDGVLWTVDLASQLPLQEQHGVALGRVNNLDALIGAFVGINRVTHSGFMPVDGTKPLASMGIMPNVLFFIGTGKTFRVTEAGTLFLGINDYNVTDNSGGFTVMVTVN